MKIELSVLSTQTPDSNPSVMLVVENATYIFGAPETLSRVVLENDIKLKNIKRIFITSNYPERIAGVMSFMIQSVGVTSDIQFTSPNFNCSLQMWEIFSGFQKGPIEPYEDEIISVQPIALTKSCCFDVTLPSVPSPFNVVKAKSLGVKQGTDFGKLAKGEDVVLKNGTIVHSSDIITFKSREKILFVDIDHLSDLEKINDLSQYSMIVHFTKDKVLNSKEYIEKFSGSQNLCFSSRGDINFNDSFMIYDEASKLCSSILPLANDGDVPPPDGFTAVKANSIFTFEPYKNRGFSNLPSEPSVVIESIIPHSSTISYTTLGSGAKYSTRYRNVSGHLLQTPGGFFLLDSGIGTLSQIRRKFGMKGADEILTNLRVIWTSHRHSDHTLGLHALLFARIDAFRSQGKEPTRLIYMGCESNFKERETYYGEDCFKVDIRSRREIYSGYGVTLESVYVLHGKNSMGCKLTSNGKSIIYSGDRNSADEGLFELGNCDLLIHEGTFIDSDDDLCNKCSHSSILDAIHVGEKLCAKHTVIVHISQRYKLKDLVIEPPNAVVSMDYLTFDLDTIDKDFPGIKRGVELVYKK